LFCRAFRCKAGAGCGERLTGETPAHDSLQMQ
jgi:hypothetical protein